MLDLIRKLVELSEVDLGTKQVREQLDLYPAMLADLDERDRKARERKSAAGKTHAGARDARRKAELDVASLRQKIDGFMANQSKVKTNKEYEAINSEIAFVRAKIDEMDTVGLEALEVEEAAEIEERAASEALTELAAQAETERSRIAAQTKEKQDRLDAYRAEHDRRLLDLPEEMRESYELLNERYPGMGVVAVKDDCCCGCHMKLVSQRVLEAHRCDASVRCDNCSRLLYDPAGLEPSISSKNAT